MPGGRPTEFEESYVEQARKLALLGATDIQIADFFGVSERTIYRWKYDFPEFCQALKIGKEEADDMVVKSLYRRALGFEHDSVKIFLPKDAEEPVYAPFREIVPPDTTACIFWLKNRRREEWRDRQEHDVSGNLGVQLVNDIPRPKRDE